MQVNAINSFSNVNFAGKRHNKQNNKAQSPENMPVKASQGFMNGVKGAALGAMFIVPVVTTTLPSCTDKLSVSAKANVTLPFNPSPADTVVIRDTIVIPPNFEFPYEVSDSLNIWRGDFLDVEAEGDDGELKNKALMYLSGARNWDYNKPEYIKLNLNRSRSDEAVYDHVIADDIKNEIRVTKVNPGEVTVVKKDGTIIDDIGGLMFNEDGVKTFAHSNGKDMIHIYPKSMYGENRGKYVELGTVEPGYLPEDGGTPNTKYGQNVLLNSILSEGTEDHYIGIKGKVIDVDKLKAIAQDAIIIED